MKKDVLSILSEKGKLKLFTDERFAAVKEVMKYGVTKDATLKAYLSIDPYHKAQWVADHLVRLSEANNI